MNDTYEVKIACSNCGFRGRKDKPKGKPIYPVELPCPNCGCMTLHEHRIETPIRKREDYDLL